MTVERISSYKCVNTRNIMIVNQTQPVVLLSKPHLKVKHTLCAQIALHSFCANRKLESTCKNHACTCQLHPFCGSVVKAISSTVWLRPPTQTGHSNT